MKVFGEVDVEIHIFLTLALVGGGGQLHASATLTPGKEPPKIIGGWKKNCIIGSFITCSYSSPSVT
jgi:hypothetical protein